MRHLLFCALLLGAAGCGKTSAPLKLYFIGSARFVAGSRVVATTDTLAARIYADDTGADPVGLKHLRITTTYSPRLTPFLYPTPLTAFVASAVQPGTLPIVYLDSAFASTAPPTELLYTTVFGVRGTVGTENWDFTVADLAGNTSSRTFTLRQRRTDSTDIYQDYTLKLNLLASNAGARRFIDLKSGLAVPGFTALNQENAAVLQPLLDAVLLPNSSLASPDYFNGTGTPPLDVNRWTMARRNNTRFSKTSLDNAAFLLQKDTTVFRTLYQPLLATPLISGLTVNQVYAFRLAGTATTPARYGLLLVASTTSGLQLRVRVTKQPL